MMKQRPNTPAPAPVAPLPPRGPQCREPISRPPGSVPFSMPRSVPFSMPIDTYQQTPLLACWLGPRRLKPALHTKPLAAPVERFPLASARRIRQRPLSTVQART